MTNEKGESAGANVRSRLKELAVTPTKRLGQNFLLNGTIAKGIIDAAEFSPDSTVVEIGPGLGALTSVLVEKFKNFSVIEIEHNFCNGLRRTYPSLNVKCADVLTVPFAGYGDNLNIISNLPYSVSTDVLLKLIYERAVISSAVILLQREFAERFAASPGNKQFGSLSVLGQLVFEASLGAVYQGGSFYPPADVESRVLLLKKKFDLPDSETIARVEKILRASFGQRRKQIAVSLSHGLKLQKFDVVAKLETLGLKGTERPEELPVLTFLEISRSLAGDLA